jgi:peptide/nickel transport system ATP-binding protein/oligopeptide transport system ATP-binding protein
MYSGPHDEDPLMTKPYPGSELFREPGMPAEAEDSLILEDLTVTIPTGDSVVVPADGVSLTVRRGEVVGIVGETGSGKTVTCRAMLGLLPTNASRHTGRVRYPHIGEQDILDLPPARMRGLWGEYISMIPQNPMTSLNPIRRIGVQIEEAVAAHAKLSKADRRERAIELMNRVGIPAAARRLRDYPHNFSGGMLQRTLIAIALAGEPEVLVADEPTTALDVIIQDQILALLLDLQRDAGMSLVLVSHDLSVIAQVCDRVAVMYAGQIVEMGSAEEIIASPRHPYTAALLASLPGAVPRDQPLATIPGVPPQLVDQPVSCRFASRCRYAQEKCRSQPNLLVPTDDGSRSVRCVRHDELEGRLTEELHLDIT